jgi:hypothetical protein
MYSVIPKYANSMCKAFQRWGYARLWRQIFDSSLQAAFCAWVDVLKRCIEALAVHRSGRIEIPAGKA